MTHSLATAHARIRLASLALLVAGSLAAMLPAQADAAIACIAPNSGGTAITPPLGCPFVNDPGDEFKITVGLPVGTEILIEVEIVALALTSHSPGGLLGGDRNDSIAEAILHMSGTGNLFGFNRTIFVPLPSLETHYAPRVPGDPVQIFPSDIFRLDGSIFGDPDFDLLILRGGSSFGLPSPGSTTLTRLGGPGSDFNVDSFFDVFYEIEYVGAPGSVLDGVNGTSSGNGIIRQGVPAPEPSVVVLLGLAIGALAARLRL